MFGRASRPASPPEEDELEETIPEDEEEDEEEELELDVVEDEDEDEDDEEVASPEELDDELEELSPELLAELEDELEFDPSLKSSEPQALISKPDNSKISARKSSEFVIAAHFLAAFFIITFAITQLPVCILRPLFLAHEVLHALVPDYFVFQRVYAKGCTHLWRQDKNKAIIHGWRVFLHNTR